MDLLQYIGDHVRYDLNAGWFESLKFKQGTQLDEEHLIAENEV